MTVTRCFRRGLAIKTLIALLAAVGVISLVGCVAVERTTDELV